MFWKYLLVTGSSIDELLDKENVTLRDLMDEEDILQECKAQTKKLIDFLVKPEILNEMLTLITEEPAECDEKIQYRYSNIACELLTFDIAQINDALANDETMLNKLFLFLKANKSLNPLLASFFSKTMGLLISKKTDLLFNYLKDKEFISLALNHLDTSAIMDLLLRFVSSIENNEMRVSVIKWLDDQKLIQQLVNRINVEYDEDVNCNASYALCHIIKSSREHMSLLQEKAEPDPLLGTIESVEVIYELLNNMFKDVTKESAIVNGILVLLELLMFKKEGCPEVQQIPSSQIDQHVEVDKAPSCYATLFKSMESKQMTALDYERLSYGVNNVLTAVIPSLEKFHNLLLNPPFKPAITLTIGRLDPPLGNCRIETAYFLSALISSNNHNVNVKLASLKTIILLMDMFFDYSWNNFLHTHVENAIGKIITNSPTVDNEGNKVHPLLDQILTQYKITVKILEKFNEELEHPEKKGYMGHLTNIANNIVQNTEGCVNSTFIVEKFKELPGKHHKEWETFVNGTLAEINKKNTIQPLSSLSLSDSSSEKNSFGKDVFTDYPMQAMTSDYVDQFGFKDDEFGDAEILSYGRNTVNPLSGDFAFTGRNSERSSELFEELCRVKINPDGDVTSWDDRYQASTFSTCFGMSKPSEDNSSDSDDECQVFESGNINTTQAPDEIKMDIDNSEGLVPMDVAPAAFNNPWESAESSSKGDQGNWADFGNFSSFGTSTSDDSEVTGQSIIASDGHENWANFSNFDAFGTSKSENCDIKSSTVSVAMETSETVSDTITQSNVLKERETSEKKILPEK